MATPPPSTKKELFARLRELIQGGWHPMPETTRYKGTGGPGNFLEDLLGLNVGNQDIADSVGWEIKYYTKKDQPHYLISQGSKAFDYHASYGEPVGLERRTRQKEFSSHD